MSDVDPVTGGDGSLGEVLNELSGEDWEALEASVGVVCTLPLGEARARIFSVLYNVLGPRRAARVQPGQTVVVLNPRVSLDDYDLTQESRERLERIRRLYRTFLVDIFSTRSDRDFRSVTLDPLTVHLEDHDHRSVRIDFSRLDGQHFQMEAHMNGLANMVMLLIDEILALPDTHRNVAFGGHYRDMLREHVDRLTAAIDSQPESHSD